MKALGFTLNFDSQWLSKKITELIIDFDMKRFLREEKTRLKNRECYEKVHRLDFSKLTSEANSMESIPTIIDLQSNYMGCENYKKKLARFKARVRVFEENYADGILKMNIFCISLEEDPSYMCA